MATKNKGQRPSEKSMPLPSSTRLEKSRKLAQKRRETYKDLMTGLMESLPFTREVLSQLDYNSRLRLALCFLKMKSLLEDPKQEGLKMIEASPDSRPVVFQPGAVQELMIEAMDGFLIVLLSDGSIIYLSESIHKHLGLFQSEHMGSSLYDLVLKEDHNDVKQAISSAETQAHTKLGKRSMSAACSFFCRMKCSRNKVANTQSKSPGFKVVHTSGHFRLHGSEAFLVALVKPVTPPSILELRMEGNMFVTHYSLDMKCIFFDGRLNHLMGYKKEDLIKKPAFDFHHHDDTTATMECSRRVQARGEGLSGYYRMLTKHGDYVWLQTRATMMFDSHTGEPSYIVCMNFIISKDKGAQSLTARKALPAPSENETKTFISEEKSKAHDPFPIPREDGKPVNPLAEEPCKGFTPCFMPSPKVFVKTEQNSPPVGVMHEEPSSTTNPPGQLTTRGDSPSENRFESAPTPAGSFRGNETSSSGLVSSASSECLPDSTTDHVISPDNFVSRINQMESVSSSGPTLSECTPASVLTRHSASSDSYSNQNPSLTPLQDGLTDAQDVFSEAADVGSVPIQPYTNFGSTSDCAHVSLESYSSHSSIYQDPVIQELPSQNASALPTLSAQSQPSLSAVQGGTLQQPQVASLSHHPQDVYSHQRHVNAPMTSSSQPLLGYHGDQQQPPLGYHGDQHQPSLGYRADQQQPLGNYPQPAVPQVDLRFNPQVPQPVMKPPQQLPACQFSNPTSVSNVNTLEPSSYQYQIGQQHQQLQQNETFMPNFNFAARQQPLHHLNQTQVNGGTGFMQGSVPRTVAPQPHPTAMSYATGSSHHDPSSGYGNPAFLPNVPTQGQQPPFVPANEPFRPVGATISPSIYPQHGSMNSTQTSVPSFSFASTPLTHPENFVAGPLTTSFGVDTMATGSVGHVTPDLVNLTGDDLKILEYIDQLDSSGGSIRQIPTAHPQHHVR